MTKAIYQPTYWHYLTGDFHNRIHPRFRKAPHLLYPQILNDSVPEEREIGIHLGLEILERCEELWICGDQMSAGMKREAAYAKARGIPVRRIPVCEIMGNQTVQELGEAIREGPDTSQSHQKNVRFGM